VLDLAYQNKETIVHHLDPRVRMLAWFIISIVLITWNDPLFLLLLLIITLGYGRVAAIPVRQSLRLLLPTLPFVLLILITNVLLWRPASPEKAHLLFYIIPQGGPLPAIPFYWETVVFSIGVILRIMVLMINVFILMKTVSPSEIALVITRLGIPPEIGMTLSMTISYIPAMIDQVTAVIEAQQSRAWRIQTANPISRMMAYMPIIMPIFFRSLHSTEAMAAAMLSRGFGYNTRGRTELNPIRFSRLDWLVTLVLVLFLATSIVLGILGITQFTTTLRLLGIA